MEFCAGCAWDSERPDGLCQPLWLVEEMFEQANQSSLAANTVSVCWHLHLTPRERDVLQGISQELTPEEIASKLSLNVKTVSTHKLTAMRKLGFKRNGELYTGCGKAACGREIARDKPNTGAGMAASVAKRLETTDFR